MCGWSVQYRTRPAGALAAVSLASIINAQFGVAGRDTFLGQIAVLPWTSGVVCRLRTTETMPVGQFIVSSRAVAACDEFAGVFADDFR